MPVRCRRASRAPRRIAGEVDLRRLPALSFELDDSFDNASHIDTLLRSPNVAADVDIDPEDLSRSGDNGS